MSEFRYFCGEQALSNFRQDRLLAKIKRILPSVQNLSSRKIYFIQLAKPLSPKQEEKLAHLLQIPSSVEANNSRPLQCIAIPGFGIRSSWANQALDILQHCGLTEVEDIEQGIFYTFYTVEPLKTGDSARLDAVHPLLHNSLTESIITHPEEANTIFTHQSPGEVHWINLLEEGLPALEKANEELELALSMDEINDLYACFVDAKRNPSDAELMICAQANSEHRQHKIFNARWRVNGKKNTQPQGTLFSMIKHTHAIFSGDVLSAYTDNAAVISNEHNTVYFSPDSERQLYQYHPGTYDMVINVETHHHPTETGIVREISREAAVGSGAEPRAGLCGFSVSNLHIPHFIRPWEKELPKPNPIASPLRIIIEAPLSAASFSNEYGRPHIVGYFRTFENETYGYNKPICITGGVGLIERKQIHKKTITPGTPLVLLGDATSSSVTSGNPEMQRRCQETINRCFQLAKDNPILSIEEVKTDDLSNALLELVRQSNVGVHVDLRSIPQAELAATPLAICRNETQARYVLAIEESKLDAFKTIAKRERCPYVIIGQAQENAAITVKDSQFNNTPVDIPLSLLLDHSVESIREAKLPAGNDVHAPLDTNLYDFKEAAERVLTLPCVASKQFLITIADRSVGGLVARDQLVGRWQVPVADVGVIANNFKSFSGSAMAIGERPISAILSPAASVRLAIAEALLNIAAAPIHKLYDVKLSTSWMAACGTLSQDSALYEGVYEAAINFCANLSVCIPVAKDALSMQTVWEKNNEKQEQISPLSLVVSAFAPVKDIRKTLTPELCLETPDTRLMLIDLGHKKNRLGGSAFAQVYQNNDGVSADVDSTEELKGLFTLIQTLNQKDKLLAYHDRSDGGLFSCICEIAFATHIGITVQLENLGDDAKAALFSEEPGVVIQVRAEDRDDIFDLAKECGLIECLHIIGRINDRDKIVFRVKNQVVLSEERHTWQKQWQQTSAYIQALRDKPECARQEWEMFSDKEDPGLHAALSFVHFPPSIPQNLPKIAILREQGVSGQSEMAAAFDAAGFRATDVHMSDIIEKRVTLDPFVGLIACGGFSYGDVLGAGRGWANTILHHAYTVNQFQTFFARSDTFALGVSNGCQMLVHLKDIIPGAEDWPIFTRNLSEQFEARFSLVQIENTPSWFFQRMVGSQLPIVVSHAEGRALWPNEASQQQAAPLVTLRYIDHYDAITEHYPENPSGSPQGCAGLTSTDGRFNVIMPHPERTFRNVQLSWRPKEWQGDYSPWMEIFMSIRRRY